MSGGTRSGGYKPEDRQRSLDEDQVSNRLRAHYRQAKTLPTPPTENLDDSFLSADGGEDMAFDEENGIDDAGAHSKLASVKVTYDQSDLDFFFINLEAAMSYAGIKSQMS